MKLNITAEEKKGLKETFKNFGRKKNDEEIFYDLCFCICAPQTTFKSNRKVIDVLISMDFYHNDISPHSLLEEICKPARFYHNKARYLVEMKQKFNEILSKMNIKTESNNSIYYKRDWLVKNVKGLGMKAASQHFMRNLGDTKLAILDTHILKFLAENAPEFKINMNYDELLHIMRQAASRRNGYLDLEKIFTEAANNSALSVVQLDALIWQRYSKTPWSEFKY